MVLKQQLEIFGGGAKSLLGLDGAPTETTYTPPQIDYNIGSSLNEADRKKIMEEVQQLQGANRELVFL